MKHLHVWLIRNNHTSCRPRRSDLFHDTVNHVAAKLSCIVVDAAKKSVSCYPYPRCGFCLSLWLRRYLSRRLYCRCVALALSSTSIPLSPMVVYCGPRLMLPVPEKPMLNLFFLNPWRYFHVMYRPYMEVLHLVAGMNNTIFVEWFPFFFHLGGTKMDFIS